MHKMKAQLDQLHGAKPKFLRNGDAVWSRAIAQSRSNGKETNGNAMQINYAKEIKSLTQHSPLFEDFELDVPTTRTSPVTEMATPKPCRGSSTTATTTPWQESPRRSTRIASFNRD
ncbi:unnamed protein product [Caenorhabditis bovis]|uniref:Uncharacterized protein n=1 Tax=Caenorhabditis bovis TaxID=2654633 RepID=A0A8S1FGG6_9PELO|nr:unnamed protein product [Caenorhabditis bovis]